MAKAKENKHKLEKTRCIYYSIYNGAFSFKSKIFASLSKQLQDGRTALEFAKARFVTNRGKVGQIGLRRLKGSLFGATSGGFDMILMSFLECFWVAVGIL